MKRLAFNAYLAAAGGGMVVIPVKLDSTVMRGTALTVERDRARSRTPCACPRPAWKHTAHLRARAHDQRRGHRAPTCSTRYFPDKQFETVIHASCEGLRGQLAVAAGGGLQAGQPPRASDYEALAEEVLPWLAYARWPRDSPSRGCSTGASSTRERLPGVARIPVGRDRRPPRERRLLHGRGRHSRSSPSAIRRGRPHRPAARAQARRRRLADGVAGTAARRPTHCSPKDDRALRAGCPAASSEGIDRRAVGHAAARRQLLRAQRSP